MTAAGQSLNSAQSARRREGKNMKIKVIKPVKGYTSDGFGREVIWLRGEFRRNNDGYFRDRRRLIARAATREGRNWEAAKAFRPLDWQECWWWFDPRSEA